MHKLVTLLGLLTIACGSAATPALNAAAPDAADTSAAPAADVPAPDMPVSTCDAACSALEKCNESTGKCVNLCGWFCTPSEICQVQGDKGTCVAKPAPGAGPDAAGGSCSLPTAWSPNLQRISKLAIADVTTGCDLDGDGKPNNVLGKVTSLYKDANSQLQKSIDAGAPLWLLDAPNYHADGADFAIAVLQGKLATGSQCAPGAADCACLVDPDSYDLAAPATQECPVLALWPVSMVKDGALQATGDGQAFPLNLAVEGMTLKLWVRKVTATGTVTGNSGWQGTTGGFLCGVIAVKDFPSQPATPGTATALVAGILKPDIALTPGGPKDAMSIALQFETVRAKAVGLAK